MNLSYLERIDQFLIEKLEWKLEHSPLQALTKLQLDMNPNLTWDQAQERLIWQLDQTLEDEMLNYWWSLHCAQSNSKAPKAA
jgi:hypothetical protein